MNDLSKAFLVGSGGFLGANARYWLGVFIEARAGVAFPWHTLSINASGSLLMGLFMGFSVTYDWNPGWRLLLAVGVLGGYTTFSSFSYEALSLFGSGSYAAAAGYVLGSFAASLAGASIGFTLARLIAGGHA
jgi:fluoride exporter